MSVMLIARRESITRTTLTSATRVPLVPSRSSTPARTRFSTPCRTVMRLSPSWLASARSDGTFAPGRSPSARTSVSTASCARM